MHLSTVNRPGKSWATLLLAASALLLSACGWVDDTGIQSNEAPEIQLDGVNVANEGDTLRWPLSSLDPDGNIQRVSLNLQAEGREVGSCGTWFTQVEAADSLRDACQPNLTDEQCAVSVDIGSQDVLLTLPALRYPVGMRYELSVLDTGLQSNSQSVDICIQTVSSPPVASPDQYSVSYGRPLETSPTEWGEDCEVLGGTGVLVNDTDDFDYSETTNGGPPCLVAEIVSSPAFASSFSLAADGSFRYVGDGSIAPGGTDSFSYRANDGVNTSEPVDVRLAVVGDNSPPLANSLSRSVDEDGALPVPVSDLGSDPEGLALQLASVGTPSRGTAEIRDGGLLYRPPADFSGQATVRFVVADQVGATAEGVLSITVRPVNDAPEFVGLQSSISITVDNPGQPASVSVSVQVRDDETDAGLLTVLAEIDSAFASVDVSSPDSQGRVLLTISPRLNGSRDLTLTVRDLGFSGLSAESASRTVRLQVSGVNDPPDAVEDTLEVAKNQSGVVSVLANDSDPDGNPITLLGLVEGPSGGAAVLTSAGTGFSYTPRVGFSGADSFTYRIQDSLGATSVGTVRITVPNQRPVAIDDAYTVVWSNSRFFDVLDNDSDPDGDPIRIVRVLTQPLRGTATVQGDRILFRATTGFVGQTSFQYVIDDFDDGERTATVVVDVEDVERP